MIYVCLDKSTEEVKGIIVLLVVLAMMVLPGWGQTVAPYELEWSTIDGGGGVSSGGEYILAVTIGQPEAGYSAGGEYELYSGFWPGRPVCIVDFQHYAGFADHWLETPCDAGNDWCGGADLNQLGDVNEVDLSLFVYEWLDYCPYRWPLR